MEEGGKAEGEATTTDPDRARVQAWWAELDDAGWRETKCWLDNDQRPALPTHLAAHLNSLSHPTLNTASPPVPLCDSLPLHETACFAVPASEGQQFAGVWCCVRAPYI